MFWRLSPFDLNTFGACQLLTHVRGSQVDAHYHPGSGIKIESGQVPHEVIKANRTTFFFFRDLYRNGDVTAFSTGS